MPVIVLHGEEEYLMEKRVARFKAELVDPGLSAFNFAQLDNPDITAVSEAALTLPFGTGNKMVLISGCTLFSRSRGTGSSASAKSSARDIKTFSEAIKSVSDHTYLVFVCPRKFDKTLKTSKVLDGIARFHDFNRERFFPGSYKTGQMNFCREEAHEYDATIDDDAIRFLLDSTEADFRQIASEIKKATIYILPEKRITLKAVREVSEDHSHVFTLLDHLAAGRKKEAIKCLDELLSRGSGIPLLATFNTYFSKWVAIKALAHEFNSHLPAAPGIMRRELPSKELATRIAGELKSQGVKAHPYGVELDLKRLKNISLDYLTKKRLQLTRLETSVKSGMMPDRHALTVFVAD